MLSPILYATALSSAVLPRALTQSYHGPEDPRIKTQLTLQHPVNGVSTTPDGRLFILYARVDGSKGPQVAEYHQISNTSKAFPNEEWNSYSAGKDPATHLVSVNSQRIGPDGKLWIVDKGGTTLGEPIILLYGPKVVVVVLDSNEVCRVYPMGNLTRSNSLLDDIRFHNSTGKAYHTDAGSPGLIVLNLESGNAVRVLEI